MSIPVREKGTSWARLDPAAKKERLLLAAADVFAREGLDAPMPTVAAAAGSGVASIYRQFGSKRELLAALIVRRLRQVSEGAEHAADLEGSRWSALTGLLTSLVEQRSSDEYFGEAMLRVNDHPAVNAAKADAFAALERLLDDARNEGRLRADATIVDLQLLFAATRAARQIEPNAERRMLQLLIDGLDAGVHST
jgi:AcrR family transcriptional regulator